MGKVGSKYSFGSGAGVDRAWEHSGGWEVGGWGGWGGG